MVVVVVVVVVAVVIVGYSCRDYAFVPCRSRRLILLLFVLNLVTVVETCSRDFTIQLRRGYRLQEAWLF